MEAHWPNTASPVVLTTDADLLDHVLAVAAVAQVEPHVLADSSSLRAEWSAASMVVVGADSAARVAALLLPRRTEVYLIGAAEAGDELSRWSVQLGAAVVMLPEAATWFATAMAAAAGRSRKPGRLIALVGGTGGVGCSTVAAGLAIVGAPIGRRALLLGFDPRGGGGGGVFRARGVGGGGPRRLCGDAFGGRGPPPPFFGEGAAGPPRWPRR